MLVCYFYAGLLMMHFNTLCSYGTGTHPAMRDGGSTSGQLAPPQQSHTLLKQPLTLEMQRQILAQEHLRAAAYAAAPAPASPSPTLSGVSGVAVRRSPQQGERLSLFMRAIQVGVALVVKYTLFFTVLNSKCEVKIGRTEKVSWKKGRR